MKVGDQGSFCLAFCFFRVMTDLMLACFSTDGIFPRAGRPLVYSECGRSDIRTTSLDLLQRLRDK